jgi:hypothetical protein
MAECADAEIWAEVLIQLDGTVSEPWPASVTNTLVHASQDRDHDQGAQSCRPPGCGRGPGGSPLGHSRRQEHDNARQHRQRPPSTPGD